MVTLYPGPLDENSKMLEALAIPDDTPAAAADDDLIAKPITVSNKYM